MIVTMRQIRQFLIVTAAALLATGASASDGAEPPIETWQSAKDTVFEASEINLADFQWLARPIVVFANSPNDPAFGEQLDLLRADLAELSERDVVIITDTDVNTPSDLRTRLRPRGFMLVLIGKDGELKLRKPFPWDVRELSRVIDKMPMRQREIRSGG